MAVAISILVSLRDDLIVNKDALYSPQRPCRCLSGDHAKDLHEKQKLGQLGRDKAFQ